MPECIIIGGGVIGLLTARRLHAEGVDVLLLERGKLGGESSWAGGGIVSPLYPWRYDDAVNRLAERSKQIYPALVAELQAESGVDCELIESGLFVLEPAAREAALAWAAKWSVRMESVDDAASLRRIEPAMSDAVVGGLWMADVMQVRNPLFVRALGGSLQHRGIAFREHTPVQEICMDGQRVTGVRLDHETLSCDCVVLASGAWSSRFLPDADIAVQPVKGQMIMYRGEPGRLKRIVLAEGHYVIPRRDGRILAGSTLEQAGFDKSLSGEAKQALQQAAVALVPMLDELPVERHWAGLRPGTPHGIPYVCPHTGIDGLYIHAGHYRNGIVLGPASAEMLAQIILSGTPSDEHSAYAMHASH